MYLGYNIKIGTNSLSNAIIVPGSYKAVTEKRVADTWKDGNGVTHYEYYPNSKTTIKLKIKPRTSTQQKSIKWLFEQKDNVSITFYDDIEDQYLTKSFKLLAVPFSHSYDGNDIFYAETEITFEEY